MGNASEDWWGWLRQRYLKRTTEALIMAAQEQAIRTNNIKAKIEKTQENSKCRLCGKLEGSVKIMLNECGKLAQKEYKRRHDWFGKKIHWEICRQYGIEVKHKPEVIRVAKDMEHGSQSYTISDQQQQPKEQHP